MNNYVVLVDYKDNPLGVCSKEDAHKKPLLHRAFSIFLYNGTKVLLQKRAETKYHSAGLITNSCCSHPKMEEDIILNAKDRLVEEINIKVEELKEIGTFVYYNKFNDNLYEYEYDHVLIGKYNGKFKENLEEASWTGWVEVEDVKKDVVENPSKYCVWFLTAFKMFLDYLKI